MGWSFLYFKYLFDIFTNLSCIVLFNIRVGIDGETAIRKVRKLSRGDSHLMFIIRVSSEVKRLVLFCDL